MEDWGVPLTPAEADDLRTRSLRHEAFMQVLDEVVETKEHGGAYIDQRRAGQPVLLSTNPELTLRLLSARGASSSDFELRGVSRSMADLVDIENTLEPTAGTGIAGQEVVSVGIRVRENKVSVGVMGDVEKVAAELEAIYGARVVVFADEPAVLDVCSGTQSCWPMKGGLRIRLTDKPSTAYCTSGFMAKRTDTSALVVLTAGHCLALNDQSGTDFWGHAGTPTNAVNFGTELGNTWWDFSNADVGLLSLDSGSIADLDGVSKNSSHWRDPTTVEAVLGVRSPSNQVPGAPVCRKGYGDYLRLGDDQGQRCGQIGTDIDVLKKSCKGPGTTEPCADIRHQWEVDFDSFAGDSGGPVAFKSFGSPYPHLIAYGTHVHSDADDAADPVGWYSPIAWGASQYNQPFFSYSYTICTASAC